MQSNSLNRSLSGLRLSISLLASLILALVSTGCGGSKPAVPAASIEAAQTAAVPTTEVSNTSAFPEKAPVQKLPVADPIVLIHTSLGDIKLQLFIQKAPQTVDNFLRNYVNRNFYDQTIFHHVDKGSLLAAGGYSPDLQPKPTRAPVFNEAANGLKNKRGTISLARDPGVAHSGTSQFFVNVADNEGLDYVGDTSDADFGYCVFGQVIEGQDVIDKIAQTPVAAQGDFPAMPQQAVVIQSIHQLK
ncbi:peptidylprolyl isomerase [Anatilimnocola aggregata]|nr:peptidylprolyl isomerase [Anatilimnocola aggregata]